MKYHLCVYYSNLKCDTVLAAFKQAGLAFAAQYPLGGMKYATKLTFPMNEAVKHRDTLIKMGADAEALRVEYSYKD